MTAGCLPGTAPAPLSRQASIRRRAEPVTVTVSAHGSQGQDARRQRGRRFDRIPRQRDLRDLSDHALVHDGRARRPVGVRRQDEHLGHRAARRRDAERGRRRRRRARRAADRRADDDVHGVAGPAADDPEHVQDRRRADADGLPRGGARRWRRRRSRSSAITPTSWRRG